MFAAAGTATATATDPSGTYNVVFDHRDGYADDTCQWTLTPCGQGCLHVTGDHGWQGDFHLIHGRMDPDAAGTVPNSVQCRDGSRHDGDMTLTFDPTSLRGKSTGYDSSDVLLGSQVRLTRYRSRWTRRKARGLSPSRPILVQPRREVMPDCLVD